MRKYVLLLALLFCAVRAEAAELRVITSGAMQGVARSMAAEFGAANGRTIEIQSHPVAIVRQLVEAGAGADIVMTSSPEMESFVDSGAVAADSVRLIGHIGVGVAVREGAPVPNISGVEEFRAALFAAQSVVLMDPAAGISSGIALSRIFAELGIADEIAAKALVLSSGLAAERVASGEAEIALQNMTQLIGVEGVTIAGPLPAEIQIQTGYSAGIAADSTQREIAAAFIAFLTRWEAQAHWRNAGFAPAAP